MVKKISGKERNTADQRVRKQLQSKRLQLKSLHRGVSDEREALEQLPADRLPPASSSNAARQARSRLNITFPVDWQELHPKNSSRKQKPGEDPDESDETRSRPQRQ